MVLAEALHRQTCMAWAPAHLAASVRVLAQLHALAAHQAVHGDEDDVQPVIQLAHGHAVCHAPTALLGLAVLLPLHNGGDLWPLAAAAGARVGKGLARTCCTRCRRSTRRLGPTTSCCQPSLACCGQQAATAQKASCSRLCLPQGETFLFGTAQQPHQHRDKQARRTRLAAGRRWGVSRLAGAVQFAGAVGIRLARARQLILLRGVVLEGVTLVWKAGCQALALLPRHTRSGTLHEPHLCMRMPLDQHLCDACGRLQHYRAALAEWIKQGRQCCYSATACHFVALPQVPGMQ